MTEAAPDTTLRRAHANDDPSPVDRPSLAGQASRRVGRFLLAAGIGGAATLAWQSYGDAARQMIASAAPQQLDWLLVSPPAMSPPSGGEMAGEANPVQASVPQANTARVVAIAPASPTEASVDWRQLETMSHDLTVMRDSVAQLAAGQEQMARDIAKLQMDAQDFRRRLVALQPAPAATAHKPVPLPQPAPQSAAASPAPLQPAAQLAGPPPQSTPQSSAPPPPMPPEPPIRPPMPVR